MSYNCAMCISAPLVLECLPELQREGGELLLALHGASLYLASLCKGLARLQCANVLTTSCSMLGFQRTRVSLPSPSILVVGFFFRCVGDLPSVYRCEFVDRRGVSWAQGEGACAGTNTVTAACA
jgi:hypothetical protein